jgi:hypothetical protein
MKFHLFAATLAWATHAMAAPSISKELEKRYPTGSFTLLAYGVANSAVNVFYSDGNQHHPMYSGLCLTQYLGLAYVGDASKWEGSVTTDVTCRNLVSFPVLFWKEPLLTPY